jgi:hypothetical protein
VSGKEWPQNKPSEAATLLNNEFRGEKPRLRLESCKTELDAPIVWIARAVCLRGKLYPRNRDPYNQFSGHVSQFSNFKI